MRRIVLTTIVVFFISTVNSQELKNLKKIRIGLKFAPDLAWIKPNSENLTNQGSKLGFAYGLITEFNFSENYGLATGIDVSYNGGKIQDKTVRNNKIVDNKYKLQYIEIPVTLKMRTNEYGYITYFGQFGFGGSYNIKSKADKTYTDVTTSITEEKPDLDVIKEDITMFRASFIIAGGIEYSLTGNTRFIAGIGFNNGLTNILKKDDNKAINNYICLNLGIIF